MRGVLAALSLAHSNPPLNNASQDQEHTGSRAHADATRLLARDAGNPDGIREAAEEEEEEREGQREHEQEITEATSEQSESREKCNCPENPRAPAAGATVH